jgi:hypothetical protein
MSKIRSVKPAKGTKGFIMHGSDIDGNPFYFFRVYNEDFTFVDYDILHYDLEVEILESDAMLYQDEFGAHIDYAPIDESK